ncbi:MAG: protein phosphatase 2C domain-containing protein [Myxococcaceae bacterium]|nr:protein phosphatase 2C domain-containing protein [Myxococcaceae bacterium]
MRLGTNNQDAVAGCSRDGVLAVCVADGCSEGAFSEVGARLIARFVADRACSGLGPAAVVDALVSWLQGLSLGQDFVQEQLLSTFLCAVARDGVVTVFGIGDGVVSIDGARTELDAGPDNAPAYAAYRLLGMDAPLVVHFCGVASRVAIATDGARALDLTSSFGWSNPHALQRRLNVTGGLHDDCSVALLEVRP